MGNADTDAGWMQICYFVEFEKNGEGIWTRNFVDEEENMTVILVGKSISFDELYKKVVEKLKIDSLLYELEMRCESPTPSKFPEKPMKIDCDDSVKWLMAYYDRTKLNITLKKKVLRIEEPDVDKSVASLECLEQTQNVVIDDDDDDDGDGRDASGKVGESIELNRLVENHNVQRIEDLYSLSEKSPWEDVAANDPLLASLGEGVIVDDPLLASLGEGVVLNAWDHNNENDFALDTYTDGSSDDSDSGEDACENSPIKDTLYGINNGSNSNEEPIVNSAPCLELISFQSNNHHAYSVRIPQELDICVNDLFVSKDHLVQKLEMMALKCDFEFIPTTSTTKFYAACCAVEKCGWRVRATTIYQRNVSGSSSLRDMSKFFQVRIYEGKHSCSLGVRNLDHRHASYKFIARHYLYKFRDVNREYRPNDIITDFQNDFHYTIKYGKAKMARNFALELIHGKIDESYEKLPKYCHMLKVQNPGTMTYIRTNKKTKQFQYFFMALGVFIRGYKSSIRQVISVDGTHLKSKFGGTLIVATCQDANLQLYPLAWGVVDSENSKAMTWFFQKLKKITGDTNEVVILSDRAASIKKGFENVFEKARHGFCVYHLKRNLETKFPRCDIGSIFWKAAQAYTKREFDVLYTALCAVKPLVDGVNVVKEYLDKAPFRYWSRAHFDGLRFDIMTTNHAESVNSLLLCARELCIISLIEEIRAIMQKWFAERHKKSENCISELTPPFEKKMVEKYDEAKGLIVKEVCDPVYQVSKDSEIQVVNLGVRTCSCEKFDRDLFPCAHAVAAAKVKRKTGYDYCSEYYTTASWKRSYSGAVFPLITEHGYNFPDKVLDKKVLAPSVEKNQSGRPPSQKRKLSAGEARSKRCGRCNKSEGHDIRTCERVVHPRTC